MVSRKTAKTWRLGGRFIRQGAGALAALIVFPILAAAQEPPAPASSGTPQTPAASMPAADTVPFNQPPQMNTPPIAIVPVSSSIPGAAVSVTGPMQAWSGRAFITSSGEITAGSSSAQVTLPYRGILNVCPATTVKLSADPGIPASQIPGLLMALDSGAMEAHMTVSGNSDVILTPNLRLLVSGPAAADLKVRIGDSGDTCVDNSGTNAPYVVVTSVFDSGLYRVQPGQRVIFQHGSLQDVVEKVKEPCGCPASMTPHNEFPLELSQGLAPIAQPPFVAKPGISSQSDEVLSYNGTTHTFDRGSSKAAPSVPVENTTILPPEPAPKLQPETEQKPRFLHRVGQFFKKVFGADSD